jgi:hypothetical protein
MDFVVDPAGAGKSCLEIKKIMKSMCAEKALKKGNLCHYQKNEEWQKQQ